MSPPHSGVPNSANKRSKIIRARAFNLSLMNSPVERAANRPHAFPFSPQLNLLEMFAVVVMMMTCCQSLTRIRPPTRTANYYPTLLRPPLPFSSSPPHFFPLFLLNPPYILLALSSPFYHPPLRLLLPVPPFLSFPPLLSFLSRLPILSFVVRLPSTSPSFHPSRLLLSFLVSFVTQQ